MRSKIGKIAKIFGKIEDPENRGVISKAETCSALVPELLMMTLTGFSGSSDNASVAYEKVNREMQ